MEARLYTGSVRHQRTHPARNGFRYAVYLLGVDIDRLEDLGRSTRWLSYNAPNVFSLWDRDHGAKDGSALRPWIDDLLSRAGIDLDGGSVTLLAFPRVLGFRFYPVSFWFCRHSDGTLRAVLAEVQNTFGGHHNYLLHDGGRPLDEQFRPTVEKAFQVSPFIPMEARYTFGFVAEDERYAASIEDEVDGRMLLFAGVDVEATPLTDANLLSHLFRLGPMPARAWTLIHFQALRLLFKGIRLLPAPANPPIEETTL